MLDERLCRRPDFRWGAPIRLADGQDWRFPGPANWRAGESPFGEEYGRLLAVIGSAEDEADRLRGELALAIYLLNCNYELTADGLASLLDFAGDDRSLVAMQAALRNLVQSHLRCSGPSTGSTGVIERRRWSRLARIFQLGRHFARHAAH